MFLESTLFLQKLKNFKNNVGLFWRLIQIAGHPSRMLQPRACVLILATCSRMKSPFVRGTQRFSRLNLRLPRGQTFQSRKTLRNFFHNFDFECFGGLPQRLVGNSPQSRKTRVWQKVGQFLKTFSVFPRTFYDYSLSLSTETHPNTLCHSLQTPFLHLFTSKSSRKRYGFLFPHLISRVLSFIFVNICVRVFFFFFFFVMGLFQCFWDCPCLDC